MQFTFRKATKDRARARIALIGPSGAGKTYTALRLACGIGGRLALIDTEHGSASKYASDFDFDSLSLEQHDPLTYAEAIRAADAAGYQVLIIDSLSHAWAGRGGALEQVDEAARRGGNQYAAWRDVTPKHNALLDAMLRCDAHLIVTMRAKTAYQMEEYSDRRGNRKTRPVKVGLAPVQREGVEYEFDIVADLDPAHNLQVTKTRMRELDGLSQHEPGEELGQRIASWLSEGRDPLARWRQRIEQAKASGTLRSFVGKEGLQVAIEQEAGRHKERLLEMADTAMCEMVMQHADQLDEAALILAQRLVDDCRANGKRDEALALLSCRLDPPVAERTPPAAAQRAS